MIGELPEQRPEGKLIEQAQKKKGKSVRQLALLADISEARWRQLVKGYLKVARDVATEQIAPAETLARMAAVVGVTAEQLAEVGRPDAAESLIRLEHLGIEVLEKLIPTDPTTVGATTDEIELIYASRTMTAREKLNAIRMVLHLRAEIEARADDADGDTSNEAQPREQSANNGQ